MRRPKAIRQPDPAYHAVQVNSWIDENGPQYQAACACGWMARVEGDPQAAYVAGEYHRGETGAWA